MHPRGLDVFGIDTGIADVGVGQRDDLARIARVSQDFLITGHRGIEHHLANRAAYRTDALAVEDRPVGKRKKGGRVCTHEKLLNSALRSGTNENSRPETCKKAGPPPGSIPLDKPSDCIFSSVRWQTFSTPCKAASGMHAPSERGRLRGAGLALSAFSHADARPERVVSAHR